MSGPVMRPALRWALGIAALLTGAVAWLPEEEPPVLRPSTVARAAPGPAARVPAPLERTGERTGERPVADAPSLTAETPWPAPTAAALAAWRAAPRAVPARPAAPPPPPPAEPAPPPPLPYQWIGQIEEEGRPRFFLADAQALWPVSPGEALATGWRVDGLQAGQLQFTWLATGATVLLPARP
jgi:hypothetical protein